MAKPKHTLGPWSTNDPSEHVNGMGGYYVFDRHGCPIGAARDSTQTMKIGEAEANARLIAAAPELLEALKALVQWMDVSDLSHVPGDGTEYSVVTDARAAIAKAEGGAS